MKNTVILVFVLLLILACKKDDKSIEIAASKYAKIEQLKWLKGNWENVTELEQSFEHWTQENDSTLLGHSFTLIGTDTVFAEKVTVKQNGDNVYFTVIAYQQNNDQPVTFIMRDSKKGVFTFENPEHDFPTRITYSNPTQDSIHAWIEGSVNGQKRKVDFLFKRSD